MIEFGDKKVDFLAASGILGLDGDGWWWEKPLRVMELLRPQEFTTITKSLTYHPCKGHMNRLKPWQSIRFIPGGTVNSIGLSNPGIFYWIEFCYRHMVEQNLQCIPSIRPHSPNEAGKIGKALDKLSGITAIELNGFAPNHQDDSEYNRVVRKLRDSTNLPIVLKIGWSSPIEDICKKWEKEVQAFNVVNAIPWTVVFSDKESPLAKYNLIGGVSGSPIKSYGREALRVARESTDTPIISGGGIDNYDEVCQRFDMGADAVSIGVLFLKSPWIPNKIISEYRKNQLTKGK